MRSGLYIARRDDDAGCLLKLPGLLCDDCGTIRPDAAKIASMPESDVPSSVRIRCAGSVVAGPTVVDIRTAITTPAPARRTG